MPQTRSMRKALRQSLKRRDRNRAWKVAAKQARRALLDNLASATPEQNAERMSAAQKALDKAAKRNVIHPNTAARRKSRLARKVAAAQS
ncbi:MAG: 30S ribosomal protein S20 [Armatimonadetes bacterium]|nr:30S ribosomal protein S20 [Armatimonadota bacterium]